MSPRIPQNAQSRLPPEDAPPLKSVTLSDGRRIQVEAVFSHLAPFGGLKFLDNQPLPSGGKSHIGARHIGKSFEYLQKRALFGVNGGKPTGIATSFPDKITAETVISLAIDAHADNLRDFLSDPKAIRTALLVRFSDSIGYGVSASAPTERVESRFVQVWLEKNPPGSPRPYEVVTAFPDITRETGNRFVPWAPKDSARYGDPEPNREERVQQGETRTAKEAEGKKRLQEAIEAQGSRLTQPPIAVYASLARSDETKETFYSATMLPGGVLLRPGMSCEGRSPVRLSKERPGRIHIGDAIFDSGLSYEEVYRLCQIAESTGHATATSTLHVEGTSAANLIGATLRFADQELGDAAFGTARSRPPELDDLLKLSSESLAARVERHLAEANAVVSLEFDIPEFRRKANVLECVATPVKVHFIPFFGSASSPRFGVEDRRIAEMFPEELSRVKEIAAQPARVFERSPHLARVQRYAATLSLLNRAVRNDRRQIENLAEYRQIFDRNGAVVTALPGSPPPLIQKCNFALLNERLGQAKDASSLLRAVGAGFLYVLGRNPSEMGHFEDLVREQLVRIVPPVTESASAAERYLRVLAGSLGLAAHSPHLPIGVAQDGGPESFGEGIHQLIIRLREQNIDGVFECLARMPLCPDPSDTSSDKQVAFPRAVSELIGLGYGADLRELLLKRVAVIGAQHSGGLAALAPGVLTALGSCFKHTLSDPVPNGGLEQEVLTGSRAAFFEGYLRVALSALAFPFVGKDRIPTLAELEHRVLGLRINQDLERIGIGGLDIEILKDFVEEVVRQTVQFDPSPVKSQVKSLIPGRYGPGWQVPELSGELRVQSEGSVRVTLGQMSPREVEEVKGAYRSLINECVQVVRGNVGDAPLASTVLSACSTYLFRVKRKKLGNGGTLIDAIRTGTLDCDVSCHIFSDVLARFGFQSDMALTRGHAHLHVNGMHFEARGGVLQRQDVALMNYGAMTMCGAHDVAAAVGTLEALREVVAPASSPAFQFYLIDAIVLGEERAGAIPLKTRVSLTGPQVEALTKGLETALAVLPGINYVVLACNETIEVLASHGYLKQPRLNALRRKVVDGLTEISREALSTKFCRKALGLPDTQDSAKEAASRSQHRGGGAWCVDGSIHDPALRDHAPYEAARGLSYIKNSALRLLRTGQQTSDSQREAAREFDLRARGYVDRLAESDILPDREYFLVSRAWLCPPLPEAHAAAVQDLYYVKFRVQDARNWAWSLPQHRSENLGNAQAVWRALCEFGDERGMEEHLGRLPSVSSMRLNAAGPFDYFLKQAKSTELVRHKERYCFSRGGFQTLTGTKYFLDRGRALGLYDEETYRHYLAELEKAGPSLSLGMEIANASTSPLDAFCFIVRFHEERDFANLRLAYSYVKPSLGIDRITLALELRELGDFDTLAELCRRSIGEIAEQAKELFIGPWLVVQRELEGFYPPRDPSTTSLKELLTKHGVKDPFSAQYLAEAEATQLLRRGDCDLTKARELLGGLTVTPTFNPGAYRSWNSMAHEMLPRRFTRFHLVLQRMFLERQFSALRALRQSP